MSATPIPDLVWRAQMSGLLKELTAEALALTEVVMDMNKRLAAQEQAAPQGEDPQADREKD